MTYYMFIVQTFISEEYSWVSYALVIMCHTLSLNQRKLKNNDTKWLLYFVLDDKK